MTLERTKEMSIPFVSYGRSRVARQHMGVVVVIGLLLVIAVGLLLARCPWPACRYLNLNTYTITTLDEYRRFLSNEAAFRALHRVAGVRCDCSALRDDVVRALQSRRLMLEFSKPTVPQENMVQSDLLRAWRQGRILHLVNNMLESEQELETWAAGVQEMVVSQRQDGLSFLPRLFGGLIIHVRNKQKPMVLFSDEQCR